MPVRIITDSASELAQNENEHITVLPMTISFGEKQYLDGINLSHRKFYELLIEGDALPTTSQITPYSFESAFRAAADAGESVVAITLAARLSGTCQSACLAAQAFGENVVVVDSENASIGEGILVRRALQLADMGLSNIEIARRLNEEKSEIRLVALLDTLEYLKRGGRLSKSAATVGALLSIKPVITLEKGEIRILGKARGSKNASNLLIQEMRKTSGVDYDRPYTLGYTGISDELLRKYIDDSAALWNGHAAALPIDSIGGTIGTHTGPGTIAVAFFQKK